MNLDKMSGPDLARWAENVVLSYAARDAMIAECKATRSGSFPIYIPAAWRSGIKDQHSSLGKSLSCIGVTASTNRPYTRPNADMLPVEGRRRERYLQAAFEKEKGDGTPGQSTWYWINDQMNNFGGCCIGTMFAPHSWADVPSLTDEEGKIRKEFWRDSAGKVTDDLEDLDDVASSRAYLKAVDLYRRRASSPIVRRYVPFDQAYPAIIGRSMMAMVIRRKVSPMELSALGFKLDSAGISANETIDRSLEVDEVWTARRCRLFVERNELEHEVYGKEGIVHNYGFVPFVYQIGLPAENAEGEF